MINIQQLSVSRVAQFGLHAVAREVDRNFALLVTYMMAKEATEGNGILHVGADPPENTINGRTVWLKIPPTA